MDIGKMRGRMEVIDELINMLGGDEDSPIEMKIMKAEREFSKQLQEIMTKNDFLKMDKYDDAKATILKLLVEGRRILKEISIKLDN